MSQKDDVNIELAVETGDAAVGPATLQITLTDADAAPIEAACVQVEGNMNHAGMVPVDSDRVCDDADGQADGVYPIPFEFSMRGDWILTVTIDMPDSTTVQEGISVTVRETEVEVQE